MNVHSLLLHTVSHLFAKSVSYYSAKFTALIGLWDTYNLLSENAKITASNLLH